MEINDTIKHPHASGPSEEPCGVRCAYRRPQAARSTCLLDTGSTVAASRTTSVISPAISPFWLLAQALFHVTEHALETLGVLIRRQGRIDIGSRPGRLIRSLEQRATAAAAGSAGGLRRCGRR